MNHTVGVGAFVQNGNEILVVKDTIYKKFKLPGGYVEDNENLSHALVREVQEETGIQVSLESIVSLGHFSQGQFGESNLYIVCKAKPLSREIAIMDDSEIIEAKWIDIAEYLSCKDVHIYNKKIVQAAMDNTGIKFSVGERVIGDNKQHEFFY